MVIPEKIKEMLQSRKFWVMVSAIAAAVCGALAGYIEPGQAVQLVIASLAVYCTSLAVVDSSKVQAGSMSAPVAPASGERIAREKKNNKNSEIDGYGPQFPKKPGME